MSHIRPLEESNTLLCNLLKTDKPFILSRPGIGGDSYVPYNLTYKSTLNPDHLHMLEHIAGIYFRDNSLKEKGDTDDLREYCKLVTDCWKQSTLIGCFPNVPIMNPIYSLSKPIQRVHNRVVEPWFIQSSHTWLSQLSGKKVLVVNAFTDDMGT